MLTRIPPRQPVLATLLLAWAVLTGTAGPAHAQYFGRNKVRYIDFRFRVLETPHFDIYYYAEAAPAAELAARMAERWYARLSELLRHELRGRQPLILYAAHPHFEQTTAIPGEIGEATGGVTEALKRRIVLPLGSTLRDTDHVLGHELVHAFQFDLTQAGGLMGLPGALAFPLWFAEGMAEYLSIGPTDAHTAMWMRDAVRRGAVPDLRALGHPRYFPYRYGHALWAYVGGRWGDDMVGEVLKQAVAAGGPAPALARALGVSADSLSAAWRLALVERFGDAADTSGPAVPGARAVLPGEPRGPTLHLAPALSPDGTRLVFLSERDRYAVEMFLADAETGEVLRKIVQTALDPHLQSLQFIYSAGAWHPDGRHFAFAGVKSGRAVLSIIDVGDAEGRRDVIVREVDEIFNPTWAPDGRRIAFTGQVGGLTDLFVLDAETGSVTRLTNDPFADLHPAWSPDGRAIAFVTDRFTTDLATLRYGDYRLGLYEVVSGAIRPLPAFPAAKHVNPQWAPDGEGLFFVADPDGVSNVYRLRLADGTMRRVTDVATGVSGIAPLSPALSVAARAERIAFSVYLDGRHQIFLLDSVSGTPAPARTAPDGRGAGLPPLERGNAKVPELLANDTLGLPPADTAWVTRPYRGALSLDYIAPISVGVGADRYGAFVGGGTGLWWSDMLGRHNLATVLQVAGSLENLTGLVGYQHLGGRWNRGAIAGQTTLLSLGFRRSANDAGTEAVDSLYLFRQINRQVTGVVAYPFSRALRLELTGGYRLSSFDREVRTRQITTQPPLVNVFDPVDLPAPDAVHLGETSAALVYDNALFGATAPVAGRRDRLEASPTFGSLRYVSVLADVRRYVMPLRPYTLAGRVVHFGRYGPDADDERLFPLFVGYHSLVRGYGAGSFDLGDCPALIRSADDCPVPVFERLLGSRMLVGNVELRFPLFEGLGLGRQPSGVPPLDAAVFFDAGVAWDADERPTLFGGGIAPVTSYGASLRTNLFGIAVLELGLVHPNDRPDRGWHVVFGVVPGF